MIKVQNFLKTVILEAGQICRREQENLQAADLEFKNPRDLVTVTDKKVETFIVDHIQRQFPDHAVLGEETGIHKGKGCKKNGAEPYLWIIDPIDGTTSFFHGQPFYSVSIALQKEGRLVLGGVYAPALDQLFMAEKGKGAVLNEKPIRVSGSQKLIDSVMATGFACLRAGKKDNNLVHFNTLVPKLRDIRRYGSAAVDLCYVACGKLDGFWEMDLNIYDIAAGALIVQEAGGRTTDFDGGTRFPEKGIIAANPVLSGLLANALGTSPG